MLSGSPKHGRTHPFRDGCRGFLQKCTCFSLMMDPALLSRLIPPSALHPLEALRGGNTPLKIRVQFLTLEDFPVVSCFSSRFPLCCPRLPCLPSLTSDLPAPLPPPLRPSPASLRRGCGPEPAPALPLFLAMSGVVGTLGPAPSPPSHSPARFSLTSVPTSPPPWAGHR